MKKFIIILIPVLLLLASPKSAFALTPSSWSMNATPSSVEYGNGSTISWDTSGNSRGTINGCQLWFGYSADSQNNSLGGVSKSGTYYAGYLTASKWFKLDCWDNNWFGGADHYYKVVSVIVNPSISITANGGSGQVSIDPGTSINLVWSSSGADNCRWEYPWDTGQPTSGSIYVYADDSTYPPANGEYKGYSIACFNNSGGIASKSVSVKQNAVVNTSVTLEGKKNPDGAYAKSLNIVQGDTINLQWTTVNPQAWQGISTCDATSGDSAGNNQLWREPVSKLGGSAGPISGFLASKTPYSFNISCNPADSIEVNVADPSHAILNVKSYGMAGVPITGVPVECTGDTGAGSTYTIDHAGTSVNCSLTAPDSSVGSSYSGFSGWTGCDSSSGRNCSVTVPPGLVKVVTANYSVPVDPGQLNGPDLEVAGSIGISPSQPKVGDAVTFTALARNRGTESVGRQTTTQLRIDLDSNGNNSFWDVTKDNTTPNLGSGGTNSETWSNAWTAAAGHHKIWVCTDNKNQVAETYETNNCAEVFLDVASAPGTCNLATGAALNVKSTGVSGVVITQYNTGLNNLPGGTTDYSICTYGANLSGGLQAPLTSGGGTFQRWTGCDFADNRSSARICTMNSGWGQTKTATAEYSTPPQATINVQSSGASAVAITRNSGPSDIAGTTNYTRTYTSNTNGNIRAPLTAPNGAAYTGWTGCQSSGNDGNCNFSVNTGETKTLTANYSAPAFNYTLTNSGVTSITKTSGNAQGTNVIVKTLNAGTSQGVSLSASGQPSGVTVSFSGNNCSPTCTSTATITVPSTTPIGDYTITVTGSPLSKTTTIPLHITGSPMTISCVPTPSTTLIGQPVTWAANITGGVAPFTYRWSGTGVPTSPAPSVNPYTLTYSTVGTKTISVAVTDADGTAASCPSSSSVQVNFDPRFQEI